MSILRVILISGAGLMVTVAVTGAIVLFALPGGGGLSGFRMLRAHRPR